MSLGIHDVVKAPTDFFSLIPDDVLSLIVNKCNANTWENLRSTNHRIKTISESYISNPMLATSIVFHHPHLYKQLSMSSVSILESGPVAASAIASSPELLLDPKFLPDSFKHDTEIKKTAYVAAKIEAAKNPIGIFLNDLFEVLCGRVSKSLKLNDSLLEDDEVKQFAARIKRDPTNPILFAEMMTIQPFVLMAVRHNGLFLQLADPKFLKNEEILLTAFRQNGLALEFAGSENQDNLDFVLVAVNQNGLALEFASERLKNNKKVILQAAQQNPKAFAFADPKASLLRKLVCH